MQCSEICIENPDPGGSQLEKRDTPSHLYTLMTPSAWHRPNAHEETMIQFQNIEYVPCSSVIAIPRISRIA
ncbi:hypothetical protein PISMIDRAFT_683820 [Pisolithus microcarpus 441]|uniref:Uncharacterized protein n=1 Tax=Pisolithus microcarpus 441 TaxID=765257 RepID=A0A0C9YQ96_9AGAM|nr:hypothetical protein PISMIDRAFT_683820 [Pisolithus microcarpus 441]